MINKFLSKIWIIAQPLDSACENIIVIFKKYWSAADYMMCNNARMTRY